MGIGCSQSGSGALWLAYMALGREWAGSGLSRAGSELYQYSSQYLGGSQASRATIIIERDCCQFGMSSLGIPGYLWVSREALVAREAYGRLPLFH